MKPEQPPLTLPAAHCPESVWARVEAELDRPRRTWWPWAAAAVAVSLAAAFVLLREPEWLPPGRVAIGEIGVVDVQPGSRVRVLRSEAQEHRLELREGAIEADISAPPRLFFVETPSTVAVDLGCRYRMETDSAGNGWLHVTGGWVSLGKGADESLVPAGASCRMRAGRGAGTPFFDDAAPEFRAALDAFDRDGSRLEQVLALARVRDTLTLWHLLAKTQGADRERVFDRMAALTPLPAGVAREAALALDRSTLTEWRQELAWTW